MRRYASHELRELLRNNPEGLTVKEIMAVYNNRAESGIRSILKNLPDSYIDRWQSAPRKQYRAVWCVVIPPEDCPHPTKGKMK
jgi:predicted Zn-ribbon and HTH transcriptional regulator